MKQRLAFIPLVAALAAAPGLAAAASSLTLFHNNDGESKLLGSTGFGGIDYFVGTLNQARANASGAGRDVLTISSGDNFLAGLAFTASESRVGGQPAGSIDPITQNYYDALALTAIGYDAITMGNHEFDFGPQTLADFITGYENAGGTAKFLSANLDFSAEASLQSFVTSGRIANSTVVTGGASGEQYGIIGVTTPSIGLVSQPGGVVPTGPSLADVANAVNAEVGALQGLGVNKIILSGHLQGLTEDQSLVPLLSGVDVIIAGGGDELLRNGPDANTTAPFGPSIDGPYPILSTQTDADGKTIALVTTQGEYRYIGELQVEFDAAGNVTSVGGASPNPILVDPSVSPQELGTVNGINIQNDILTPLQNDVAALQAQVVGATNVNLDGRRASVRTVSTNLGTLVADALVYQAQQIGGLTGAPVIGVANGGGIRNDSVIGPGDLTVADVFGILPFSNSVAVINGLSVAGLVSALENAVSRFPGQNGGFLQITGFEFKFNSTSLEIEEIKLDDGTVLYTKAGGVLYGGTLDLVTSSFTAGGGDGFDEFAAIPYIDLGVNYGEALRIYIEDHLNGQIDANDYPENNNRISAVPLPAPALSMLALIGIGGIAAVRRRKRG